VAHLGHLGQALVPSSAATLLAGVLATMLVRRGLARARPAALIGGWVALLVAGLTAAGRGGLGTLLTAAFVLAGDAVGVDRLPDGSPDGRLGRDLDARPG
jgi:hypothetical protein